MTTRVLKRGPNAGKEATFIGFWATKDESSAVDQAIARMGNTDRSKFVRGAIENHIRNTIGALLIKPAAQ